MHRRKYLYLGLLPFRCYGKIPGFSYATFFCGSHRYFCNFEAFKRIMIKFIPRNLATIISGFVLFIVSCTADSCFQETTSFLNASFYKTGTSTPVTADSITIYGISNETVKIYDKALKVSTIKLPLDASTETCGFVIKINTTTDTIKFTYSSYPHLISKECGITFYHTLDSYKVSGSKVDTIIFRNNNITILNEENIRIFY